MEKVIRLSFVRMYYIEDDIYPNTPNPFMEFRVFVFTDKIPTRIYEMQIIKVMKKIIEHMKNNLLTYDPDLLDGLFSEEGKMADVFNLKNLSRYWKIQIDGMEVEEVDIDEIKDRFFKQERENIIINKDEFYRYMAFFNKDGTIKQEYDEWDIQRLFGESELENILNKINKKLNEMTKLSMEIRSEIKTYKSLLKTLKGM